MEEEKKEGLLLKLLKNRRFKIIFTAMNLLALIFLTGSYVIASMFEVKRIEQDRATYQAQIDQTNRLIKDSELVVQENSEELVSFILGVKTERPEFLDNLIEPPILSLEEKESFEFFTIKDQKTYTSLLNKSFTHVINIVGFDHMLHVEAVWLNDKVIHLRTSVKEI